MARIRLMVNDTEAHFECPGCGRWHAMRVTGPYAWEWNGSLDRPTFKPSILGEWTWGPEKTRHRCHSFVRDGRIEFLGDCTHAMAGQTVDLPEVDE